MLNDSASKWRSVTHRSLFLSLIIITSMLPVIGGVLTSCSTPTKVPVAEAEELPSSDEIRITIFTVEEDERIIVERDLHIIAEEKVVVLGEILGKHGATIEITAPSITIHGTIQAGDGDDLDGVLEHGHDGGSVILNAPHIDLTGAMLAGGNGGGAGPAGNGGHGGNIVLNDVVNLIGSGALDGRSWRKTRTRNSWSRRNGKARRRRRQRR